MAEQYIFVFSPESVDTRGNEELRTKLASVQDILHRYNHTVEVRPLKYVEPRMYPQDTTFLFDSNMQNIAKARKNGYTRIQHVDNSSSHRDVVSQIAKSLYIPEIEAIASGHSAQMPSSKLQMLLLAAQDLQRYTLADLVMMAKHNGIDTDDMTHHDLAWLNALANLK